MPDEPKTPEAVAAENKPLLPDAKVKEETRGISPLPVNLIGTRSEGTGAPIVDGQEIVTPDHQPNLIARVTPPIVAIIVRASNVFLNTLLGGLGLAAGSAVTGLIPWANWKVALAVAASAALVNALQSTATIFGNLERNHPLLTGSI